MLITNSKFHTTVINSILTQLKLPVQFFVLLIEMEGRISESLKQYGYTRSKVLEVFGGLQSILVNNLVFHCVVGLGTTAVVAAVFSKSRSLTLFSLHPVFMIIGTFVFLAEGIVEFRNSSLLTTLGPIMQHSQRTKVGHTN